MKIIFLGTSAGWPLPRLGCQCEICQSKDSHDKRLRPSVLINDTLLIDAPPDIYHQLVKFKIDISKLKSLVMTHAHPDHILGFYDLTHLYNLKQRINLFLTREVFNKLQQAHPYPLVKFLPKIVSPKKSVQIENLKVTFLPVPHNKSYAYAIKIKGEKIFLYIPDLSRIPKSERKTFRDVHILVLDGSSLGKAGQTHTHESIEEGIRLAQDLKAKFCYFTHIGHITGTHEELEKFVQKKGGRNFHIAYDGLGLET